MEAVSLDSTYIDLPSRGRCLSLIHMSTCTPTFPYMACSGLSSFRVESKGHAQPRVLGFSADLGRIKAKPFGRLTTGLDTPAIRKTLAQGENSQQIRGVWDFAGVWVWGNFGIANRDAVRCGCPQPWQRAVAWKRRPGGSWGVGGLVSAGVCPAGTQRRSRFWSTPWVSATAAIVTPERMPHHLRKLTRAREISGQAWAGPMIEFLTETNDLNICTK